MPLYSSLSLLTFPQNDTKTSKCMEMWRLFSCMQGLTTRNFSFILSTDGLRIMPCSSTCHPFTLLSILPSSICTGQSLGMKLPSTTSICNPYHNRASRMWYTSLVRLKQQYSYCYSIVILTKQACNLITLQCILVSFQMEGLTTVQFYSILQERESCEPQKWSGN